MFNCNYSFSTCRLTVYNVLQLLYEIDFCSQRPSYLGGLCVAKKKNLSGAWYSVYVTIISRKNDDTKTTFLLPTPLYPLSRAFINLLSTALHCHHLSLPITDTFLCKFTVDWNKIIERLRFTFTPNGKREFVPRNQVFPLIVVHCLLLQLKNN